MKPLFDILEERWVMSHFHPVHVHIPVHNQVHHSAIVHHNAIIHPIHQTNQIHNQVHIVPKVAIKTVDTTIPFIVGADVSAAQNAVNFTSNTFQNVLFGTGGWDGIQQIANRFSVTNDTNLLTSDLTALSFRMPFGNQQLLQTWLTDLQSLQSGTLTPTTTIFFSSDSTAQAVSDVLYANLQTYLSAGLGTSFNILKSVINWDSDNLLTYNGFVGSNDLT